MEEVDRHSHGDKLSLLQQTGGVGSTQSHETSDLRLLCV